MDGMTINHIVSIDHGSYTYSKLQNYGNKKKVTINRWAPVYHGKILDFFFLIFFFSIITFFHNSVGWNTSIDSQFECILTGNIKLWKI